MRVKRKIDQRKEILLGISTDKYLISLNEYGMAKWFPKEDYEELKKEPKYLLEDNQIQNRKVVDIFKRKYDLEFYTDKLQWNESLTPQYFQNKRLRIALSSIGLEEIQMSENKFTNDSYFLMLISKFETINEIIDSQIQIDEAHSRFEWYKTLDKIDFGKKLSDNEIEKGIIELCRFVASKIIKGENSKLLFTDIYALWKTFLLGEEFLKYGEINLADNFKPQFICTFKKGEISYHFNYQYYNW